MADELIIPTYEQYVKAGQLRGDWQALLRYIVKHEETVNELDWARQHLPPELDNV